MNRSGVRLYDLLPPYVRLRDHEEGQPLAALMNALQEPFERVYADIEELYRAWFIETCAPWQVPYIGDLLGVSVPAVDEAWMPSLRSRVANALAYRRAKGTAVALERVASDVTGWSCFVGEGRAQVVQTFSTGFATVRSATFDLRNPIPLGLGRSPFAPHAGTVAIGPDTTVPRLGDDGRRNLSDVSLSLWRLRGYPVHFGELRRLSSDGGQTTFSFHPLGVDAPLFDQPPRPDHALYRAQADNVPRVLDPGRLREALHGPRADTEATGHGAILRIYLQRKRPASSVGKSAAARTVSMEPVANEEIRVDSLADSTKPMLPLAPMMSMASRLARSGTYAVRSKVIVDPLRGRLVAIDDDVEAVFADFTTSGIADIGGGAYGRSSDVSSLGKDPWRAVVVRDKRVPAALRAPGLRYFSSLRQALVAWNGLSSRGVGGPPPTHETVDSERNGLILIADSCIHPLPAGAVADSRRRNLTIMAAEGHRPVVVGDLRLIGPRSAPEEDQHAGNVPWASETRRPPHAYERTRRQASRVHFEGLAIDGTVRAAGRLALEIRHCLLTPACSPGVGNGKARVAVDVLTPGAHIQVAITRSICGPLRLVDGSQLNLTESTVQGRGPLSDGDPAIEGGAASAGGTRVEVERCTVIGATRCGSLNAVDSLFVEDVSVARREVGELAHCYLPHGERAPALRMSVTGPKPIFLSTRFGDPGYARLAPNTPQPIAVGGSRGEEIGVYSVLRQNTRLKNLDDVFAAYLPPGKSPRIIFET